MAPPLRFFTGSDAKMLPQAFILLQSFAEAGAADDLAFCDFGLTAPQRRLLERRWHVLDGSRATHPWVRKASLIDYIGGAENAVWIDADMILLRDPRPELARVIPEMAAQGHVIAACADYASMTLDRYVAWCASVGAPVGDLQRGMEQHRISGAHEYLNSGFFVVRRRRWLKDW